MFPTVQTGESHDVATCFEFCSAQIQPQIDSPREAHQYCIAPLRMRPLAIGCLWQQLTQACISILTVARLTNEAELNILSSAQTLPS